MSKTSLPIRALLLALATLPAHAQPPTPAPHKTHPRPTQPTLLPNVVLLLDPAHGGPDNGATLAPDSLEKDAASAFAGRLRTLLAARGFTVLLTHDASSDQPPLDQRAEAANRSRAAACILIHAATGGHGVHLFTSSLTPISPLSANFESNSTILPWDTAQATSIQQSLRLAFELSDAIHAIRVPLVVGHVSVPPIDSMTCPAVALELAPLASSDNNGTATPASDADYQQRIAQAIADALVSLRAKLVAEAAAADQTANPAATPPIRKPKPIVPPIETPAGAPPPPPKAVPQ